MTIAIERAARQVVGRDDADVDDDDDAHEPRHRRHGQPWSAPITLPVIRWTALELPFWDNPTEFAAALAERKHQARRHGRSCG